MIRFLLNLIFPPQCLNCKALVATHGTLCVDCWQQIQFIADPMCDCCGLPFEFDIGKGALCAECVQDMPPYSRARAAFRYDASSRALVLQLKYNDQLHLAAIYGPWLAKAGKELIDASDIIVPVPLHYRRFIARRYNQAALLANAISKHSKLPVAWDALKRTRATQQQTGLTRKQREENVKGAFSVPDKYALRIKGKSVLLVDDVLTTGATLEYAARALLNAGAISVYVLTLARRV